MSGVILKEGKEKSVLRRHPWIFSGAIQKVPIFSDGEILPVYSASGKKLASAYFHTSNSIAGRILSFGEEDPLLALDRKIRDALILRKGFDLGSDAYRLINSEGDGIPGLIVDLYKDVAVIQVNTAGIERLKSPIISLLVQLLNPKTIYEKSISSARRQEGLADIKGVLYGEPVDEVVITENGIPFIVSIPTGQKTGFFLDQREMRKKIASLSRGKRVLNCFSYSGGFSLAALTGGALHVDSIDISEAACALARRNSASYPHTHAVIQKDVFEFLRTSSLDYDLIILDPPAFAKKRSDLNNACQGYKEINRAVMQKIPNNSILVTSSCSSYIEDALFKNLIFQAAQEAGRFVRCIGHHISAPDHPVSVYHPEGHYLKSEVLYVSNT